MVLDKIRTDGVMPTLKAVRNKLDQPLPLGYCNVGVVVEVGAGVTGFAVGDRVACNGKHAEVVSVPVNLCARIPDDVSDEQAAFTVVGAIALQGIRLAAADARRSGRRDRPRPDRPDHRAAAARQRLPRARHRSRSRAARAGAERRRRNRGPRRRRGSGRRRRTVLARPRRRRGARHRRDPQQRADAPGGADVPQARPHRPGRRDRAGAVAGRLLQEGAVVPGVLLVRARPLRPGLRREGTGLSRRLRALDRAAELRGRARHDGRRPPATSTPLVSHRFPLDQADAAYDVVGGSEPSLGILLEYPSPRGTSQDRLRTSASRRSGRSSADSRIDRCAPGRVRRLGQLRDRRADPGVQGGRARSRDRRVEHRRDAPCTPAGSSAFARPRPIRPRSSPTRRSNAVVIATRHDSHARARRAGAGRRASTSSSRSRSA